MDISRYIFNVLKIDYKSTINYNAKKIYIYIFSLYQFQSLSSKLKNKEKIADQKTAILTEYLIFSKRESSHIIIFFFFVYEARQWNFVLIQ